MSTQQDTAGPVTVDVPRRLGELLGLDPEHRLLQYGDAWTTVGQAASLAARLDRVLRGNGVGPSAKVAVLTRNRAVHVCAIAGLLASERCLVPVTSIQSDAATVADLERSGAGVLVADREDWERAALAAGCRKLGVLGVRIRSDGVDVVSPLAGQAGAVSGETAPGVAVLMPTSGTTGLPKRIPYTFAQLAGALGRIARYSPATARALGGELRPRSGVVIATLTMAHVAGFWTVLQALAEGRRIALLDRFEPEAWAALVAEHRVAMAMIPPSTLTMILDAGVDPERLASLKAVVCGTAPLDPDTQKRFTDRYGVPVLTAYGATEFPGGIVGWNLDDYRRFHASKPRSAGRPRPGIRIKIVDPESGAELPAGVQGLIAVHSPQATTPTPDGWVRTNDFGSLDEDGFLYVHGRADDAINRGGFKVVPQVVEAVLREHPAVVEAAVVGRPDQRLGAVPVAAVELRSPASPDEILAWLRERVTKYQVPVELLVVDSLPRTASLKVSKQGVRELVDGARSLGGSS